MTRLTPEVEQVVLETVGVVYETLAEHYAISTGEVATWGVCRKVTLPLMMMLRDYCDPGTYYEEIRNSWSGGTHSYPVIREGNQETIIEAAWQQFVPKKLLNPDLPPVLIGSRREVVRATARAGVWKCDRELWQPFTSYHDPRVTMQRHPSNHVVGATRRL